MVAKLSAAAILEGLKGVRDELAAVSKASQDAEKKIKQIAEVSHLLTALPKVLDLGLALLAAATGPAVASIAALMKTGTALSDNGANAH